MRTLVTGGCGFLGSHLCDALVARGDSVVALDNMVTGWNMLPADVEVVKHDVSRPFPAMGKFDRVYNLACPASPVAYQRDPIGTWKTSILGVINAVDYIDTHCAGARLLQASTSEVYGDPLVHPQPETYWGNVNTCGVRSCYDEGKRAAETYVTDNARHKSLDARIVRIFNTYGPRMSPNDGRVVSNFVVQALRGEPLTVYGDGRQTRSFCYVSDLIEGLVRLMESDVQGPVNIGNPVENTMLELASKIRELTDWKSNIVMRPLPADDPTQRCPDIARAKTLLDWEPRVSLHDGLRMTIEYFEQECQR